MCRLVVRLWLGTSRRLLMLTVVLILDCRRGLVVLCWNFRRYLCCVFIGFVRI